MILAMDTLGNCHGECNSPPQLHFQPLRKLAKRVIHLTGRIMATSKTREITQQSMPQNFESCRHNNLGHPLNLGPGRCVDLIGDWCKPGPSSETIRTCHPTSTPIRATSWTFPGHFPWSLPLATHAWDSTTGLTIGNPPLWRGERAARTA